MNHRDEFIVYFIKPVGLMGPIKIGLSASPARRLANCESWSPLRLELIGAVPGTWDDEQFLHECLVEFHSHGEWFHAAPAVIAAVEAVISTRNFDCVRASMTPKGSVRSKKNRETRSRKSNSVTSAAPSDVKAPVSSNPAPGETGATNSDPKSPCLSSLTSANCAGASVSALSSSFESEVSALEIEWLRAGIIMNARTFATSVNSPSNPSSL
jgi:hypothetical protein